MDALSEQMPPSAPSHEHDHQRLQPNMGQDGSSSSSSQSQPRSISDAQFSRMAYTTDQVVTPPASDTSGGIDGPGAGAGTGTGTVDAAAMLTQRCPPVMLAQTTSGAVPHASQLHHLSAVAAAQDRLQLESDGHSRKRMADGEVKDRRGGSLSPAKGHARTTSAVSVASTTASTISDLSAELRTRLSYAMVKVNHGWQGRCLDEVESLASQAASPTSSTSTTIHRGRNGSSVSPRLPIRASPPQMYSATASRSAPASQQRRNSDSHPSSSSLSPRPTLAPPAMIQPSLSMSATRSHARRNSNPRYAPTMLSLSQSASSASQSSAPLGNDHLRPHGRTVEPILHSPHKNVREQDAIETLLFMSSPGHSANLKHSLSPFGSPGPQAGANHHHHHHQHQRQHQQPPPRSARDRHALPTSGSSRRGLPSNRPPVPAKKVGRDKSPALDPAQHHPSPPPNRASTKQHAPGHRRSALSLPSGLGLGNGTARKTLRDEDIERMLDRAGAELGDSSDDEEIQLPPGRNGLARVTGA
ncbi:hypothetical protein E4U53_005555 [Claviceps sorghi]|nr:hypothetical protein E4U53_005555 [Claviceps sorghi]